MSPKNPKHKNQKRNKKHLYRTSLNSESHLALVRAVRDSSVKTVEEQKGPKGMLSLTRFVPQDGAVMVARKAFNSMDSTVFRFRLRDLLSPTADVSGNYAGNIAGDPSGAQDWSSFAAIFDLFRVVAIKLKMEGRHPSVAAGMGYFALAFDANSTPTPALATMLDYDNFKLCSMARQVNYTARYPMLNGSLASNQTNFISTAAPSGMLGSVMVFGATLPVSLVAAQVLIEYEIEFMMKGN